MEARVGGDDAVGAAAMRFRDEAGCDAVKFEAEWRHAVLVEKLSAAGIETIAHLGLRPQSVLTPDGYRAQAREEASIAELLHQHHLHQNFVPVEMQGRDYEELAQQLQRGHGRV